MNSPRPSISPIAAIEAHGIAKVYGKKAVVCGIDITINAGEIVGLLGPNGAGKTTTFYVIVGLIPATRGQVFCRGQDITGLPMYRRARLGIGYLPQEASVFRKLTVRDNILAIVQTLPLKRTERDAYVERYLAELELTNLSEQKAYTLSGGERRRLEITRALVTRPHFILMDEPFSGVDPISIAEVQDVIMRLKEKGIGVLITDHNVRETLKIVDRAYLLHQGQVLYQGTSDDLVNDANSRKFYLGEAFHL